MLISDIITSDYFFVFAKSLASTKAFTERFISSEVVAHEQTPIRMTGSLFHSAPPHHRFFLSPVFFLGAVLVLSLHKDSLDIHELLDPVV